jgi:hypothetical protein
MSVKEKIQCPIRLYKDQYQRVRAKASEDNISFQKLGEVLFGAYLKGNKEIMKLVEKHASEKSTKKKRGELTDLERDELLRVIEQEYSPLRELEETIQEIDDEQSNIHY